MSGDIGKIVGNAADYSGGDLREIVTPQRHFVLWSVRECRKQNGKGPTFRWLQDSTGLPAMTLRAHIGWLTRSGYLFELGRDGYSLTGAGQQFCDERPDPQAIVVTVREPAEVLRVVTVRLPDSLHRSLKDDAHGARLSLNALCCERLSGRGGHEERVAALEALEALRKATGEAMAILFEGATEDRQQGTATAALALLRAAHREATKYLEGVARE